MPLRQCLILLSVTVHFSLIEVSVLFGSLGTNQGIVYSVLLHMINGYGQ